MAKESTAAQMLAELKNLSVNLQSQSADVDNLTDRLSFTGLMTKKLSDGLSANGKSSALMFVGLGSAIKLATGTISQAFAEANAVNKAALSVNRSLSDITEAHGGVLKGMAGGLFENTKSSLTLQQMGFKNLNRSTVRLATTLRLTGQDASKLLAINKQLIVQGRMSEAAADRLSRVTEGVIATYNVAADRIVEATQHLAKNMGRFGLMEIGGTMTEAVEKLTGRFGGLMADTIGKFSSALADPTTSSALLSRLGIFDLAQQIRSGTLGVKGTQDAIMQAIEIAGNRTQSLVGNLGGAPGEVFEALLGQMGGSDGLGMLATQLQDAEVAPDAENDLGLLDVLTDLGSTLKDILSPLQADMVSIFSAVNEVLQAISPALKVIAWTALPALGLKLVIEGIKRAKDFASLAFSMVSVQGALNRLGVLVGINNKTEIVATASRMAIVAQLSILTLGIGALAAIPAMLGAFSENQEEANELTKDQMNAERLAKRAERDLPTSKFATFVNELLSNNAVFQSALVQHDDLVGAIGDLADAVAAMPNQNPLAPLHGR